MLGGRLVIHYQQRRRTGPQITNRVFFFSLFLLSPLRLLVLLGKYFRDIPWGSSVVPERAWVGAGLVFIWSVCMSFFFIIFVFVAVVQWVSLGCEIHIYM